MTNSAGSVRRQFILGLILEYFFFNPFIFTREQKVFSNPMKDSQRPPKILSFKENHNGDLERFSFGIEVLKSEINIDWLTVPANQISREFSTSNENQGKFVKLTAIQNQMFQLSSPMAPAWDL